jgi:heterodisulfide reductase subunit A2
MVKKLEESGTAEQVFQIEQVCTREGWNTLLEVAGNSRFTRILIGACMPYVYARKLKELGQSIGLHPSLIEIVDIRTPVFSDLNDNRAQVTREIGAVLSMAASRLKGLDPVLPQTVQVTQKALVVGGGIAGMTTALSIADHGYEVDLVEVSAELGGNLRSLYRTLDGLSPGELLEKTITRVERHPNIRIHKESRVLHSTGQAGRFFTTIEKADGIGETIAHGVAVLATGGREATTRSYGYGQTPAIMTQHELEEKLHSGAVKPGDMRSVAIIQCVDSREEPRNYCSRICCAAALKNAIFLKGQNPELDIYILYRDMMAYGAMESFYTQARKSGIIFIQYRPDQKPSVKVDNGRITVTTEDPVLGREIVLQPDLLALSTGIIPGEEAEKLAGIFSVPLNQDGFYQEAEYKWRPVDFIKEGIFVCGIAHSPRSITETIAMAEAAAQRALTMLTNERVVGGSVVAEVRHTLCSLCESCIAACPYGARWHDEDQEQIVVDELSCQGCGSCAAVCPNSASVLRGYRDQQMFSILNAALDEMF